MTMAALPLPPSDEADRIAADHLVWAASQGLTPAAVLRAIDWPPPLGREPTWFDAQIALADEHRKLETRHEIEQPPRLQTPPLPAPPGAAAERPGAALRLSLHHPLNRS